MAGGHMKRWVRTAVVVGAAAVTVYLVAAAVGQMGERPLLERAFQLVSLFYLVPGTILVLRRDGHLLGWLLIVAAVAWAVQLSAEVPGGGLAGIPRAWLAWMLDWVGYAQWTSTVALFVLFPDGLAGRTPRQRRAASLMLGLTAAVTVLGMLVRPAGTGSTLGPITNPTGLGFIPSTVAAFLILPILAVAAASVLGLWLRSRGVSGDVRRQYRLVLYAFSVVVVGLVCGLSLGELVGDAAWLPIVAGWFLIPTAFSVAILRYHLYDIDRVVSRTIAYAGVTLVMVVAYAIPVVALPSLFGVRGPLAVASATLAAAGVFNPARRLLQTRIDRRFNRATFDARRELEVFATHMRSEVDIDTVVADIQSLVTKTLQPATATTWIRLPPGEPHPHQASAVRTSGG